MKKEEKYLKEIILGNKNYEIRKLENKVYTDDGMLNLEYTPEIKMTITVKSAFACRLKNVEAKILNNIFCLDENLDKYRAKERALKEMKRFYGDDFTEDTEVVVFHLDN